MMREVAPRGSLRGRCAELLVKPATLFLSSSPLDNTLLGRISQVYLTIV